MVLIRLLYTETYFEREYLITTSVEPSETNLLSLVSNILLFEFIGVGCNIIAHALFAILYLALVLKIKTAKVLGDLDKTKNKMICICAILVLSAILVVAFYYWKVY
jgi:hypothetical protein